jgi:outer membrane receptor protein involved in Fe transport
LKRTSFEVSATLLAFGFGGSSFVLAQERSALALAAVESSELVVLDEMVVAETPILDSRIAFEEGRIHDTATYTGTTRADFEHRPNNRAGDILKRLPGVFMGGPPGERNDVRLRGLDKEFSRAQLDGLSLPDGGEKRELQFDRVPAHFIDEVRILRSPTAEFESDGLAGRVALTSAPIPAEFSGRLRFAYGERNTSGDGLWHVSGQLGGRVLPWLGLQGTASYFDDPYVKTKYETNTTAAGTPGKSVTEVERKRLTAEDYYLKAAAYWQLGHIEFRPLRLELLERKFKTKTDVDPTKSAASDEALETETEDKTKITDGAVTTLTHAFVNHWTFASTFGWHRTHEDKGDKIKETFKESGGVLALDKRTLENEAKADEARDLKFDLGIPLHAGLWEHRFKTGLALRWRDRFRDKSVIEFNKRGVGSPKVTPKDNYYLTEDYTALYLQDTIMVSDRFTVLPGLRIERVSLTARDRTSADVDSTRTDANPTFHAAWRVNNGTTLKFAIARAINRPKFDELSPYENEAGDKFVQGNPALRPSRATNFDLSLEHARPNAFLGVNVFRKNISDVIEEVFTGETRGSKRVFQVVNAGDGWTHGVEFEQRLTFGWTDVRALRGLTLWANETLLRSEFTDSLGRRAPFKEQPEFLANVGLDWEVGRFILTTSAQHRGRRGNYEGADRKELAAETIFDLALRVRVWRGASMFVEIANLTDEERWETTFKSDGSLTRKFERGGRSVQAGVSHVF